MAAHPQKNNKPRKPGGKESQPLIIAKTPAEKQRLKLESLMRNPDKPAPIPDRPKEWNPRAPPEFVRDVMGSSAGAGSREFHVYRHLRCREYQRQEFLDKISVKVNEDIEYLDKVELNKQAADDRTAQRRKKREKLKRKMRMAKMAEKVRQERERVRQQNQQERMERKNQIPKRKKGKLPSDFPEETMLHKRKQKPYFMLQSLHADPLMLLLSMNS
nr:PRKR-interacting protein 1 homolog [Pseudochaenichthys georgianus]